MLFLLNLQSQLMFLLKTFHEKIVTIIAMKFTNKKIRSMSFDNAIAIVAFSIKIILPKSCLLSIVRSLVQIAQPTRHLAFTYNENMN